MDKAKSCGMLYQDSKHELVKNFFCLDCLRVMHFPLSACKVQAERGEVADESNDQVVNGAGDFVLFVPSYQGYHSGNVCAWNTDLDTIGISQARQSWGVEWHAVALQECPSKSVESLLMETK